MRIKVHGGTAFGSENLCRTCRHATFIKGHAMSKEVVYCSEIGRYINFPVSDCSDYHNKCQTTLREMKDTAWVLVPKKGQGMGFVTREDFRRMAEARELDRQILPDGDYDDD